MSDETKQEVTDIYSKVERFVDESFAKEGVRHKHTPIHLKITVECIKLLEPNADEALLVAALSHDIERAFVWREIEGDTFKDPEYLKAHQEKCAEIITGFLKRIGADPQFTERVGHLVSKHEDGGDDDQNLLKDADSLAFFKGAGYKSIAKMRLGANLRGKIDYMYNRITSDKAKEIAKPLYEEAVAMVGAKR